MSKLKLDGRVEVDTPLTDKAIANITNRTKMSEAEARATLEKISPQNRLVTPEEVAHVALMLVGGTHAASPARRLM